MTIFLNGAVYTETLCWGLIYTEKKTHKILPPTISPNMVSSILKIQDQASFQAVCGKELLLYAHL